MGILIKDKPAISVCFLNPEWIPNESRMNPEWIPYAIRTGRFGVV